jgi:hypothetical protein
MTAMLMPIVLFMVMLVVQAGVYWNTQQRATAAAKRGAQAAALTTGTEASGQQAARTFLDGAAIDPLNQIPGIPPAGGLLPNPEKMFPGITCPRGNRQLLRRAVVHASPWKTSDIGTTFKCPRFSKGSREANYPFPT